MSSLERCPLFRVSFKVQCINSLLPCIYVRDLYIRSCLINCQSKGCNAEKTHIQSYVLHKSDNCAIDYPITGIYIMYIQCNVPTMLA